MFDIDNSIIDDSNIICPDFEIENKDPNDEDLSDMDYENIYGFRMKEPRFDSIIGHYIDIGKVNGRWII